MRCHRSRGEGEAERTNSAISDALVDGATLEWEKHRRREDLSEEEIKQMSPQSYEGYGKNGWRKMPGMCAVRLSRELTMPLSLKNTSRVN